MVNPGFRIKKTFARPEKKLIDAFAGVSVASIGDAQNRMGCMNSRIVPLNSAPLAGCAFTVRVRAGENLLLHKAIDMALPGDVIVVDAQNDQSHGITGELMISWLRRRGVAGLILDGCLRDIAVIRALTDFPVYAAGVAANGPTKAGGGEINFPITCGGVVVNPGDIVVGDADGVVVVSPADAAQVLAAAKAQDAKEVRTRKEIETLTWDRSWVDAALTEKGCEFIE